MNAGPKLRLFVGVELPAEVREAIEARAEALHGFVAFRWTPAANLHLTLAFLGWVEPGRVEEITERLAGAAADLVPFEVRVGGAGRFPERGKARVLWVGLDDAEGRLTVLADRLRRTLDVAPEGRPFRPHVTVGRARQPVRAELPVAEATGPAFVVDTITLFRSHLARPHPRYEPLARVPLGARRARIP
jgi:RNA 2',3'-cyclic 3'-phosphodiesterase